MPGPPDIPDIPDPSATEAPKQFGSAVREILEPHVFEPTPVADPALVPVDENTEPDTVSMDDPPPPRGAPRPVSAMKPPPPVDPEVVIRVAPVHDVPPEPDGDGQSVVLRVAVFGAVVVAVVAVILVVAFGGATVFGLVLGLLLR